MNDQPTNKLSDAQSPYLRQHARNPVNWHPWGAEALEKARDANKPILLSIGYSTCHWCHVMAEESFADQATAALMNRHFVCIKVDREERPDLDKVYITAVSAMSGSAGWPLNVFLTPDRLPFFGGTYFPPETRPGMPSWRDVLTTIADHWQDPDRQDKLKASGRHIHDILERHLAWRTEGENRPDGTLYNTAVDRLAAAFDARAGGFSPAPKFPSPGILDYLLTCYAAQPGNPHLEPERSQRALDMALFTLRAMARGGIQDQLGGGFHRYATDGQWQLPHFEKMLYDNAQLLAVYTRAHLLTGDAEMAATARATADYLLRDLQHPEGGFYAAEDADSLRPPVGDRADHTGYPKEGAFYVWTAAEIDRHLSPAEAAAIRHHSAIGEAGNAVQDPHGEFDGENIIFQARALTETAQHLAQPEPAVKRILTDARRKLFAARQERPRPHCDRKIITAWNGLAISALAQAHQAFGEARYLEAARRAADFILDRLYDPARRSLFRCRVESDPVVPGIADDHLFFVQALLDLYESDFQAHWLKQAHTLMDKAVECFYDAADGGFFMTRPDHDPHLILRVKEDTDNVLPAAASVGALNLIRLSRLTGREVYAAMARRTIASSLARMESMPEALPAMLKAALTAATPLVQVTIDGAADDAATAALVAAARSPRALGRSLVLLDSEDARRRLAAVVPFAGQAAGGGQPPRAWVCIDRSCRDPVTSAAALRDLLDAAGTHPKVPSA